MIALLGLVLTTGLITVTAGRQDDTIIDNNRRG
jgi:hypothetical protein